jgi:AraC-like DNA-binding protein
MMYEQIREDILYIMLYAVVAALALTASCYLLLRRGNAFAADITPPQRLRRWAAAFLASIALNHGWYMPIFFVDTNYDIRMTDLIGGLLDGMTFFPLAITVMLTMLQDRRRQLWPAFVMMAPMVGGAAWSVANNSYEFFPVCCGYGLLLGIGFITYMVRELRQYGRWLRDNYADLEHKEVWQSFVVLAIIILVFGVYAFTSEGPVYQYSMQVIIAMFICYLLWRVETLSDLSIPHVQPFPAEEEATAPESIESHALSSATHENISQLLQQYCVDTQLYLLHDLSISQLAKAVGTNRFYLSQYFSGRGITYNAYINDLRIQHFVRLYHEAVAAQRSFTAQQLAYESGYRSYSTFSLAFKQRMGQTVTAWMHKTAN